MRIMTLDKTRQLAVMLLLALFSTASCAEPAGAGPNLVHVTGIGTVDAVPDEVRFVVGIDARALTPAKAFDEVEEQMQDALRVLRKLDVPDADIQAMQLSIVPVYDYKQGQRLVGHDARRNIRVTLRNIEDYARAMDAFAEIDVNRFEQVQLQSSKRHELELEALERAVEHARSKAERIASISGQSLQGLRHVQEQGASAPTPPMARMAMAMEADSAATVAAGSIEIQARISASFAME